MEMVSEAAVVPFSFLVSCAGLPLAVCNLAKYLVRYIRQDGAVH
jgi:hypothetical protein